MPFWCHQPNWNPGIEYATEEDELLDKLDGMDIDGDGEDGTHPLRQHVVLGKKRQI